MRHSHSLHTIVVGAGAAGLMAARELARAGRRVSLLEARDRCGGRIHPLPFDDFGYAAEAGAEFVHGEAPLTHRPMREAGLTLLPIQGSSHTMNRGNIVHSREVTDWTELYSALQCLREDMPVAEFLRRHFDGSRYIELRRWIERMAEGYDAADPEQASTLALREEWMLGGHQTQGRILGGYGALIDYLTAECRRYNVDIRLGSKISAVELESGRPVVRCADGKAYVTDHVILTVPLPLLERIELPSAERAVAAAAADVGFGNVIKILLRFETAWWHQRSDLQDLTFILSDAGIPVWWTQYPATSPVLTGWFAGPRTATLVDLTGTELVNLSLASLAEIFGEDASFLRERLVVGRAINWANDPQARGAYSYATPRTRDAQAILSRFNGGNILFSGEALYRGRDMGTVEAALASGLETACNLLGV